ncbi:hypothetical protein M493_01905 [Geobacillus genomosp. 3]|uniref:Uncharacterized protein n=1 Tax=Geobacillus genomosp. 3 TaxID=1921421 RepID=S5Z179_GEOG3|nr:hypothetical protein M493_01905 [Geobacillus genomosp. 3]
MKSEIFFSADYEYNDLSRMGEGCHNENGGEEVRLVRAYALDVGFALFVFLFFFLFSTFNVGYYAYGSFLVFAIGSLLVGLARI